MLRERTFAAYEREHSVEPAAVSALIEKIERSAPLALPVHRTSAAKLPFLQEAFAGK